MTGLGDLNLSLILSAVGSVFGTGVAGMAAVGSWKKAFSQNKAAPFIMIAFVGAPLTQTIYGMILRNSILAAKWEPNTTHFQVMIGAFAGIVIGLSAYLQGKAGAKAADALGETGKGFTNYIMVLGVIETVALFVMIFARGVLP
ncbi:MAG: V-type ATP synthase subunit K [bacterium]